MIWGISLEPGQRHPITINQDEIHLSMAALSIDDSEFYAVGSSLKQTKVMVHTSSSDLLLCTLVPGMILQQTLDLRVHLQENISFSITGQGTVYLTGYVKCSSQHRKNTSLTKTRDDEWVVLVDSQRAESRKTRSDTSNDLENSQGNSLNEKNFRDTVVEPEHEDSCISDSHIAVDDSEETEYCIQVQDQIKHEHPSPNNDVNFESLSADEDEEGWFEEEEGNMTHFNNLTAKGNMSGEILFSVLNSASGKPHAAKDSFSSPENSSRGMAAKGAEIRDIPKASSFNKIHSRQVHSIMDPIRKYARAETSSENDISLVPQTESQPFQGNCQFCEKTFTNEAECQEHEHTHPECTELKFLCKVCGKKFATKKYFKRHLHLHTGLKPFKCQHCDKTFAVKEYKKTHEFLHTGLKPYNCRYCDKTFAERSYRRKHEFLHSGQRPYKCTYCDKSFNKLDSCNKHMISHTGSKKFVCEFCGQQFKYRSNVTRHKKLLHENSSVGLFHDDVKTLNQFGANTLMH